MAKQDEDATETEDKATEEEGQQAERAEAAEPGEEIPVRLSRRQQAAKESDERIKEMTARAERAEQLAQQIREESNQNMMRLQQALLDRQQPQQVQREERTDYAAQIAKQRKKANEALGSHDLDEYQERLERITELQIKANAAAQPRPQPVQQSAAPAFKPPWVTAVEMEFPEVVMHPQGIPIAAQFEGMLPGQWGPEKLRAMMTKARDHLGIKPPKQVRQRQELYAGAGRSGGSVGGPRGGDDDDVVTVSKQALDIGRRMGIKASDVAKQVKIMRAERGE